MHQVLGGPVKRDEGVRIVCTYFGKIMSELIDKILFFKNTKKICIIGLSERSKSKDEDLLHNEF